MNTTAKTAKMGLAAKENRLTQGGSRLLLAAMVLSAVSTGTLWARGAAVSGAAANGAADDASLVKPVQETRALRLSSVEGQVRVMQDGQILADPALANMPLFAGTQIATGNDGRAEVQFEDGSLVRISPNSTLTFPTVEKHGSSAHTEAVLNSGLVYFELQPSNADHTIRVSYGSASFAATSFTVVRVTLDTPPGELAVFSGNVHLDRGDALQVDVHGGETLALNASDPARYQLVESIEPDSWDTWNADRDQALNAQASEQTAAGMNYANAGVTGSADLDANGNWYNVPGQGYIWSPYDAQAQGAGWDPYGFGHWVYYPGRGYVWVSGYGWGYAAFDCGMWNYYDSFGWGWLPGAGGCSPWWGFGGGGWGYNIGVVPTGYRPPRRPILPPRRPEGGSRELVAPRVLAVDHRLPGGANLAQYNRPVQPVTIAGHVVEPLKPVASRPSYDRTTASVASGAKGYFPAPSRPANASGGRPVPLTSHPGSYSGGHPAFSSSSSSAHASYSGGGGGGGGGGGHVSSGGGGGGGGGGTHK